jgi:hypothetical protein
VTKRGRRNKIAPGLKTKPAREPCRDFDLAPLIRLDRTLLLPSPGEPEIETRAKRFALVLSLVFNDLKAIVWAHDRVMDGRPYDEAAVTAYTGQWQAMRVTFTRMGHGLLYELAVLIKANSVLLNWEPLRNVETLISNESAAAAAAWRAIVDFALERKSHQALARVLRRHRNELAFHYDKDGAVLLDGYRRHFGHARGEHASYDHAYVSLGPTMEQSRFYYADAAAIAAFTAAMEAAHVKGEQLRTLALNANLALRFVVGSLLAGAVPEDRGFPTMR